MVKQLLSAKDKEEILVAKAKEIRSEFFETYQQGFKDLDQVERKKLMKKVPWNEHMTVTSDSHVIIDDTILNAEVQREVQLYQLTMDNVQRAIAYLTQEGVPLQKPEDYDVEMFKSPKQVNKIHKRIYHKEQDQKDKQERRMKKQSKKLSKIMKNKQVRDEIKHKKENQKAIEEWKKEIRVKGSENARDLNDFIVKNKKQDRKNKKDDRAEGIRKKNGFKTKPAVKPQGYGIQRGAGKKPRTRGGRDSGTIERFGGSQNIRTTGAKRFNTEVGARGGFRGGDRGGIKRGSSSGRGSFGGRGGASSMSSRGRGASRGGSRGASRGSSRSGSRGQSRGGSRGGQRGGSRGR